MQDLGERPVYDIADLKVPQMNEFMYGIFVKLANSWPLGKLLLWKIKRDSEFHIVERFAARLPTNPLYHPNIFPSAELVAEANEAAASFDMEKFILSDSAHYKGSFVLWAAPATVGWLGKCLLIEALGFCFDLCM